MNILLLPFVGIMRTVSYKIFPIFIDHDCKISFHNKYIVAKTFMPRALQYSSINSIKCWNCNFILKSDLFCSKCKVVQEVPENRTYFNIIGIKQKYDVSNTEIHDKYRQLQMLLHPDKFGNRSEREKQISEQVSALINKAYDTLQNPLKRGLYMLELNNISIPEGTSNLNPEFLLYVMGKNEEIEEASNNKEKVLKLIEENKEVLQNLIKCLWRK
ncbi:iron-sulfur cluster co-chaperone protein HscB isoform X2 [Prorops nasuta]|uniref:iron-sulfur cluster co-chaperone protein HscB isoform X2 n=1 Tax=Prorops nasuta TaxID=863751 RepID=UPI0034CE2D35